MCKWTRNLCIKLVIIKKLSFFMLLCFNNSSFLTICHNLPFGKPPIFTYIVIKPITYVINYTGHILIINDITVRIRNIFINTFRCKINNVFLNNRTTFKTILIRLGPKIAIFWVLKFWSICSKTSFSTTNTLGKRDALNMRGDCSMLSSG